MIIGNNPSNEHAYGTRVSQNVSLAVLKGADLDTMEEMHQSLLNQLNFPPYYGGNLSALADELSSITHPVRVRLEIDSCHLGLDHVERFAAVCCREAISNKYLTIAIEHW